MRHFRPESSRHKLRLPVQSPLQLKPEAAAAPFRLVAAGDRMRRHPFPCREPCLPVRAVEGGALMFLLGRMNP